MSMIVHALPQSAVDAEYHIIFSPFFQIQQNSWFVFQCLMPHYYITPTK